MPPVSDSGPLGNSRSRLAVAIIPARYHSTRLPGKALADIAGSPMIAHVYRRVSAARSIASVMVATDDDRIVEAVRVFGGNVVMTSPTHLSGTDRLAEVAAGLDAELIVNVQGDEPLIDPAMIDEAVAPFAATPDLQMSTLRRRIERVDELENPHVTKVVVDAGGFAMYFSRYPLPYRREGAPAAPAWKHVGLYVYRRDTLLRLAALPATALERSEGLEQLRALEHGIRIRCVETAHDSIGVDTPDDLDRVRRIAGAGTLTTAGPRSTVLG